jgi:hypothetical protein
MWQPSTDFSYGFAAGISFFLLVEIVRCIRTRCCKNSEPQPELDQMPPSYTLPVGIPPVIARKR